MWKEKVFVMAEFFKIGIPSVPRFYQENPWRNAQESVKKSYWTLSIILEKTMYSPIYKNYKKNIFCRGLIF